VIVAVESPEGAIQMQVTTIGLDIAKNDIPIIGMSAYAEASEREKAIFHDRGASCHGADIARSTPQ
jgi:hypothetical protein